ncbi:MAG: MBG domain-containing protein, partial [Fulvivirga sp.]|nr:MBG domain-containing protein [Fulvivirga sp.]
DREQILQSIADSHGQQLVKDTIALLSRGLAVVNRGLAVVNESAWTISETVLSRGLAVVNGNNAYLIDASLIEEYAETPSGTFINRGLAVVNADILANGDASIQLLDENGNVIGNRGLAVVNRGLAVVNDEVSGESNSKTIMIVDETDTEIGDFSSINYITGLSATPLDSPQYIIPGAFYSRNFIISYGVGELHVNKAELTLTADDNFIDELEPLPPFTSTFSGFVANETFEDVFVNGDSVKYNVSPTYNSAAGVYEIHPFIADPLNYFITPVPGVLYVNPASGSKIRVWMECTEMISNHPSGYQYRVYFSYDNRNDVPWYIPEGPDNRIIGTSNYEGDLPEVFYPGVHIFSVVFDGSNMYWELTSNGTNKTSQSSSESVNSEGCSISLDGTSETTYTLSPNPTTGNTTLFFHSGDASKATITVYDDLGFIIEPPMIISELDQTVNIDFSWFPVGFYYILIEANGKISSLKVYRE